MILSGLWEVGRIVEVQQVLFNAAREAARPAATGQYTNAQVQQVALSYTKFGLNDTNGTMTQNATVTVSDLTNPGTDASSVSSLDVIQVVINLPQVTTAATMMSSTASWLALTDSLYPNTAPQPPQG
jgi:hypothetical protein